MIVVIGKWDETPHKIKCMAEIFLEPDGKDGVKVKKCRYDIFTVDTVYHMPEATRRIFEKDREIRSLAEEYARYTGKYFSKEWLESCCHKKDI